MERPEVRMVKIPHGAYPEVKSRFLAEPAPSERMRFLASLGMTSEGLRMTCEGLGMTKRIMLFLGQQGRASDQPLPYLVEKLYIFFCPEITI